MIIIEPSEAYACRMATSNVSAAKSAKQTRDLNAPLRFSDGWDDHILAYVSAQAEPVRIVSLASQLRKCVRHRDKRHKDSIKHDILIRVVALIRTGRLARFSRKYVVAHRA